MKIVLWCLILGALCPVFARADVTCGSPSWGVQSSNANAYYNTAAVACQTAISASSYTSAVSAETTCLGSGWTTSAGFFPDGTYTPVYTANGSGTAATYTYRYKETGFSNFILVTFTDHCPSCGGPGGTSVHGQDSLGYVTMNAFLNPDGSSQPSVSAGTVDCESVSNCVATATDVLDLGDPKAGVGISHVYMWVANGTAGTLGTTCSTQTPSPGSVPSGNIGCTNPDSKGAVGCVVAKAPPWAGTTTPQVGDAADVVKNSVDLGASITPLTATGTQDCMVMQSGATLCTASATNPPDTGVPNQAATPDGTLTTQGSACPSGSQCTYNYYNSTTTARSTNDGNANSPAATPKGQCPAGTSTQADGTCGSTGTCPAGESKVGGVCKGTSPDTSQTDTVSATAFGTVATFSESIASFSSGVSGSPMGTAISGLTIGLPDSAGGCVAPSFSALGTTFTMDSFCTMLDDVTPVLRGVSITGFALAAVVLFFMA